MQDSMGSHGFRTLLRELRLSAGLTQTRLAERAGLAERTIQDLERGRSHPTRQTAIRLIAALGPTSEVGAQFHAAASRPRRTRRTTASPLVEEAATAPSATIREAQVGQPRQRTTRQRLPTPVTTFIGREQQLADVARLLESRRLVTLTGPGGCGKTRLAIEVAARAASRCPDGVYFVSLAPLSDPRLVPSAIAAVLKIRQTSDATLASALQDAIGERRLLLVLDNVEHLLSAVPLVGTLLTQCPNLIVLATSRELLRLSGEQVYVVPPLTLPRSKSYQADDRYQRWAVLHSEAVQLFADRAASADARFRLTVSNAPDIAAICERVDGLPLAIELAAARVHHLSPREIRARLAAGLALLSNGPRDAPARHQTLMSTIAWSHDLLSEEEQRLFRSLSVFRGGFTIEGAQAVAARAISPQAVGPEEADATATALEGVASLVAKSLVHQHTTAHGDSRFTILETVREFAAEQLEAGGEAEAIRRRHVDFYMQFVEQAERPVRDAADGRGIRWLEAEHDNLRAALIWCDSDPGNHHLLPYLTNPLWMFWWQRGHWAEACRWYDRVLDLPVESPQRLGALRGRAQIAVQSGDLRRAAVLWDEAIALARVAEERLMLSVALGRRAYTAALAGKGEYAQVLADEALDVARQLGDGPRIALALNEVGHATRVRGDTERARLVWEESLRLSREIGLGFFVPYALQLLSSLAVERGDLVQATAQAEEALGLFWQRDDRWGVQTTQSRIIRLAQVAGDRDRVAALARENLMLTREIGSLPPVADHLIYLAWVARLDKRPFRAARLLGAAEAIWQATGRHVGPAQRQEIDAELSLLRDAMGEAACTAAQEEGRLFSVDQAIREALDVPIPSAGIGI
jgi:predicted ATPase/DNA-binding XRE family transcriptional regulator